MAIPGANRDTNVCVGSCCACLSWSEALSGASSWHGVRLDMEFAAAFMRTRLLLRGLDIAGELPTIAKEARRHGSETATETEKEDDRPTLPEAPEALRSSLPPSLPAGESEPALHGKECLPWGGKAVQTHLDDLGLPPDRRER